jgi:hypothetical protein
MKILQFKIVAVLFVSSILFNSCTKKIEQENNVLPDYPKMLTFDHTIGKLIIEYESGKKVEKEISKDSVPKKQINTTSLSHARSATQKISFDEDVPVDEEDLPGFATYVPNRMGVECSLVWDSPQYESIIAVTNYVAYSKNPTVFLDTQDGNVTRRTVTVHSVGGFADPLPGNPVTVTWYYQLNYVYVYYFGNVITRQVAGKTVRMLP